MDEGMPQKSTKSLVIWALTDNKPGHRNQLEGLTSALSELRDTRVEWISVSKRLEGFSNFFSCKKIQSASNSPDLIIAAGHRTHIQLLSLKHCLNKPAVVFMKPSLPMAWFDLCLIPRHDNVKSNANVIETLGPVNKVRPSSQLDDQRGLILLGGSSRHFKWQNHQVLEQIAELLQSNGGIEWQLASSRRTPDDFYEELSQSLPSVSVIRPEDVASDWLPAQMQQSGQTWVTEDSVSMMYEAITSGAKVGVIQLIAQAETRVTKEVKRLLNEKRIRTLHSQLDDSLPVINEADRCAALLLSKLSL